MDFTFLTYNNRHSTTLGKDDLLTVKVGSTSATVQLKGDYTNGYFATFENGKGTEVVFNCYHSPAPSHSIGATMSAEIASAGGALTPQLPAAIGTSPVAHWDASMPLAGGTALGVPQEPFVINVPHVP